MNNIQTGTVPDNTLKSLRTILFRELNDLRSDEVEPEHAVAISKVSSQIISSYNTEINAVKVANDLKERNLIYANNLSTIQTVDTAKEIKTQEM